ncbi:MAG TPA: signal peptidase I [Cellulomonas sp.]
MSQSHPDGPAPEGPVWTPRVFGPPAARDGAVPLPGPEAVAASVPVVSSYPGPLPPADEPPVPQRAADGGTRRSRRGPDRKAEPPRSGPLSWLRETAIVLVSALVLSLLVKTFLVQAFWIPSQSMHDTLVEDDRILVSKLAPGPMQLHRGDIVVFKDPGGWLTDQPVVPVTGVQRALNDVLTFVGLRPVDAGQHLVKRVIGVAGDHVACAGAGSPITVNGVALDEPYVAPLSQPSTMAFDITVPAGSLWVMGDNRDHSEDSRYHQGNPGGGSIPLANVVGVAFVIVWPADRWTVLRNPGATFADVPDPS